MKNLEIEISSNSTHSISFNENSPTSRLFDISEDYRYLVSNNDKKSTG